MTPTALVLIVLAAILHAGWNGLSKRSQPSAAFFLIASLSGGVLLSPVLLLHRAVLPHLPPRVWWFLLGTGFCMALYYAGLAGAYRRGHLSVAYPLARSSPVLIVTMVTAAGGAASSRPVLRMGAVLVVRVLLLPKDRLAAFRSATTGTPPAAWRCWPPWNAGYTILDEEALRHLRACGTRAGNRTLTLLYALMETFSVAFWLVLGTVLNRRERAGFQREVRQSGHTAMVAGLGIWASYLLVLLSLALVSNVSYVAAFRQLSIPLGVLYGVTVLKEPVRIPKIAGTLLIAGGWCSWHSLSAQGAYGAGGGISPAAGGGGGRRRPALVSVRSECADGAGANHRLGVHGAVASSAAARSTTACGRSAAPAQRQPSGTGSSRGCARSERGLVGGCWQRTPSVGHAVASVSA